MNAPVWALLLIAAQPIPAQPADGKTAETEPTTVALGNPACTIENARYRNSADPDWQLLFGKTDPRPTAASDLLLIVTDGDIYRNYAFSQSQGFGGVGLLTTDEEAESGVLMPAEEQPEEILHFHGFRIGDTGGAVMLIDAPQADDPAPAAIYLPDLSRHYWYDGYREDLETGERTPARYDMPRALFLPECMDG